MLRWRPGPIQRGRVTLGGFAMVAKKLGRVRPIRTAPRSITRTPRERLGCCRLVLLACHLFLVRVKSGLPPLCAATKTRLTVMPPDAILIFKHIFRYRNR